MIKWYDAHVISDEKLTLFIEGTEKPTGLNNKFVLEMVEEAKRELERRKIARTKLGKVIAMLLMFLCLLTWVVIVGIGYS